MIAQRYNPLSYVCIIAIACFSVLTSSTVILGEVDSPPGWMHSSDQTMWYRDATCDSYQPTCSSVVWLNTFSPLVCMCILFFPLVVVRSERLLKMRPYVVDKGQLANPTHVIVTRSFKPHRLGCCGFYYTMREGDVPDDEIVQVALDDAGDGSAGAGGATAAVTSAPTSETEMASLSSIAVQAAAEDGPATGAASHPPVYHAEDEAPSVVSPTAATSPVAVDPVVVGEPPVGAGRSAAVLSSTARRVPRVLTPADITDDVHGLPLSLDHGKWKIIHTPQHTQQQLPRQQRQQQEDLEESSGPDYRAWKAWELVLWPRRRFPKWLYSYLHYLSVGTGIALGWAGLSIYLRLAWDDSERAWDCCGYSGGRTPARVVVTLLLAVSFVCAVVFTLMGHLWPLWPRMRTLFEGICLLTVDLGIIFAALYSNALV